MLKDMLFLTKKVFDEALIKEENLPVPKKVYDVYRNLEEVISDVKLVANHYLALDFSEGYLQDSSWGQPVDKWRKFFNMDLEELNESVKTYLFWIYCFNFPSSSSSFVLILFKSSFKFTLASYVDKSIFLCSEI